MTKIDISSATLVEGCDYPTAVAGPCQARSRRVLGDAAGLSQFGVNLLRLPPGAWSSLRHWHSAEDEFVWVVSGTVILVSDSGEESLAAGDCAGFKAGDPNAHHIQNRSDAEALVLEMGSRRPQSDRVTYPDADLSWTDRTGFVRRTGTPAP